MKKFLLLHKEGNPFLRLENPLAGSTLISKETYEEHERQYIKEAVKLIFPVHGKTEYLETEINLIWRFNDNGKFVELAGEPSFINTKPQQYEQVFKPFIAEASFQTKVHTWLLATFGPEEANGRIQRLTKFFEEATELAQALGFSKEEALRIVIDKFTQPPGEPEKETGDVLVTLAGLCQANGIDMIKTAEAGIESNIKRSGDIKLKWLLSKNENLTL